MTKIINRGDREAMLSAMDRLKAAAAKGMTEEDRTAIDVYLTEIRKILEEYTPAGLN